jgi:uncharacterized protein (DUF2384 family)
MKETMAIYTPKSGGIKSASVRALGKMAITLNVPIASVKDLHRLSRAGLSASAFEAFAKKVFSRKDMEWIIPARTFSHRQKGGGRLTTEESDKLLRAAKIQALASEILGSEEMILGCGKAVGLVSCHVRLVVE